MMEGKSRLPSPTSANCTTFLNSAMKPMMSPESSSPNEDSGSSADPVVLQVHHGGAAGVLLQGPDRVQAAALHPVHVDFHAHGRGVLGDDVQHVLAVELRELDVVVVVVQAEALFLQALGVLVRLLGEVDDWRRSTSWPGTAACRSAGAWSPGAWRPPRSCRSPPPGNRPGGPWGSPSRRTTRRCPCPVRCGTGPVRPRSPASSGSGRSRRRCSRSRSPCGASRTPRFRRSCPSASSLVRQFWHVFLRVRPFRAG